uniref:Transcription factor GTE8 n=1 Tax=Drosophila rhopaloa TaxID=1041015 RepID=A0A6P4FKK0_DRORH
MACHKSLSVKLKLPNRVQPEVVPQPGKAGQYTNKMHYFKKHVLDEVCKKKFALDFLEPVDTEALKVPTYYAVIDRPMDVGTILKRVQNNYYRDVEEAISDFRLIIRNCFMFNRPGDVVFRKGQMLEKFFVKKIKAMPQGPDLPCNKDPKAVGKPRANAKILATPAHTERLCRELLKKLQNVTNQADTTARNFFNAKWDSLVKKLDKHYFKTFDEFRSHVDGIFRKYHDPGKMIYERAINQSGSWSTSLTEMPSPLGSSVLSEADLNELLQAAKLAEMGLMQCLQPQIGTWEPSRARSLVEAFCASVGKVKLKLEASRSDPLRNSSKKEQRLSTNQEEEEDLNQGELKPARDLLKSSDVDALTAVSLESTDDEGNEAPMDAVNDTERRNIQKLFAKLPSTAMREIVHLVQQTEGLSSENCGDLSFDVKEFAADTLVLMKRAVAKAMRAHSKLNLKDMQPSEKEGLQRTLQSQLVDITQLLNRNRRRNAAPLNNLKSNNNKNNNNVVRKRPCGPVPAKLKQPPGGKLAVGGSEGCVGESRNLSDTSDDSSGPPSPQRRREGKGININGSSKLLNLPRKRTPPQKKTLGSPKSTLVSDLQMSSSSSSESLHGSRSSSSSSSASSSSDSSDNEEGASRGPKRKADSLNVFT